MNEFIPRAKLEISHALKHEKNHISEKLYMDLMQVYFNIWLGTELMKKTYDLPASFCLMAFITNR